MIKVEKDVFASNAERALQDAVADAIEAHRRTGKLIVVARNGNPVRVDPNTVRTVREQEAEYRKDKA